VADAAGSQATAQALFPANTILLNSDLTQIASMYNSGVYNFLWDVKNIPINDFVEAPFQYGATVSEPTGVFFRHKVNSQGLSQTYYQYWKQREQNHFARYILCARFSFPQIILLKKDTSFIRKFRAIIKDDDSKKVLFIAYPD